MVNNVTTLPAAAPPPVSEGSVRPDWLGEALDLFRLPDVSAQIDVDDMSVEQCADFAYECEQRLLQAARLFGEVCRPIQSAMMRARARVDADMAKTGGTKLMRATFDVVREQPKEKQKYISTLLQLRKVLPSDVTDQVFSNKVTIKGAVHESTLEELRQIIPESMLEIKVDADGAKLNTLLRQLGAESVAGKIIAAGYKDEPKGNPVLKFVPRESAIKKAKVSA